MTRISALTLCSVRRSGGRATPPPGSRRGRTRCRPEDPSAMQSATNRGGAPHPGGQEDCSVRKKAALWSRCSLRGIADRRWQTAGPLPGGCKPRQTRSNSLIDFTDPQRTTVTLEKQDDETFGFEVQTCGLQAKSSSALEMCTFVCGVHEDSVAEAAGLSAGDVIVAVNGVSTEGACHQRVVDLISESSNRLQMETVCGNVVKRMQLQKRMAALKKSLREKVMELQALTLQEKRLTPGDLGEGGSGFSADSAASRRGRRFSSDSSCVSAATDDSDHASVFGDASPRGPGGAAGATDDGCFFARDFSTSGSSGKFSSGSSDLRRALGSSGSSGLAGSSGSLSPSWEETRFSSLFGTLPRRSRRGAVHRHILKLIPGFQRSLEEEESGTSGQ